MRGGVGERLPCGNPPLFPSPGTETKIREVILRLLGRLSREQNSAPSAASLERGRSDDPRWGIAGSFPASSAQDWGETKKKLNLS